ncbi:Rieske 2Fe-2S domain-containing protein [Kitasatospora sp. NPDC087314]|uniref:Rieske 2Fe-2S domain-containing protein n=1 Tax=Kitasatospora sp. NPDC087314 TaxID=3364068 RepID=UPI0038115C41
MPHGRALRPTAVPSGWFCVGRARDLPPGRVRTARLMGEDVVLYRTGPGAVRAVGPHCPHLGARFGAGGTVRGEDLVCPFTEAAGGSAVGVSAAGVSAVGVSVVGGASGQRRAVGGQVPPGAASVSHTGSGCPGTVRPAACHIRANSA